MSGGSYYVPATSKWPILGSLALAKEVMHERW